MANETRQLGDGTTVEVHHVSVRQEKRWVPHIVISVEDFERMAASIDAGAKEALRRAAEHIASAARDTVGDIIGRDRGHGE